MKQLLQNLRNGKIDIEDVPVPTPGPGMILIRTAASLVSAGTERMVVEFAEKSLVGKARSRPDLVRQIWDKAKREGIFSTVQAAFRRIDQPMPLGYSSAGTIVALGEGVPGFQAGQRVACAGGGYALHAEYSIVPKNLVTALPDSVSFEAAAFSTLGAIALHGFRLAEPQIGERVAVVGLGLLGLLTAEIAKAAGCQVFGVDLDPRRVELAKELGVRAVLREGAEESAQSFSQGVGFDAVLICADAPSNDPINFAGAVARDRARIVAVGAVDLELPRAVYFQKELTFMVSRSYGPGRYDAGYEEGGRDYPIGYVRWTEGRNLEAVVAMLADGSLDVPPLISHRIPIEAAADAYELITGKREEPYLGIILTYPEFNTSDSTNRDIKILKQKARRVERSDHVNLGVIGAGNFATATLLPALRSLKNLELIGIAAPSGLSAQQAARRYKFNYATSNESKLLDDSQINTVAILTRHNLHAEQVVAALQAGKHVFCEKPLALNEAELSEIESELKKEDCPLLTVGFNRRFAPMSKELKQFLSDRNEPLVAHYRVNAGHLPTDHWLHDPAQGGGRIVGEACHFVDMLTYLVGASPISVVARGLPHMQRYREDNVVLTFTFPEGSIGTVTYLANGDTAVSKEKIEVFVEGRVAVLDDFRSLKIVRAGKTKTKRHRWKQNKGHNNEWLVFIKSIRETGIPPIPYEEIFGVTRATFAAIDSLRNDIVVKVK
ncbi:MAG: bi-domain-containing oxidoreductase [Chloroflexi bacterium]|nr:bi-domain-containing oxidoreductase [Chloroflexota bacterium]